MGNRESQLFGGLTVRVRIRGRDNRSEQEKHWEQQPQGSPPQPEGQEAGGGTDPSEAPSSPVAADPAPAVSEDPISVADEMYEDVAEPPGEAPPPSRTPKPHRPSVDWSDVPDPDSGADTAYVPRPVPRVMAVANQKGGVGKTTTAVNLGAGLAEIGFRVLVIDLDPQGNATTGLGIDGRSFELSMYDVVMRDAKLEDAIEATSMKNLFVAPATIDLAGAEIELVPTFSRELKLRRALESVIGDFDYILIDCPPSLGLITVNGLAAADEVLVPIQCEYYALEGLGQLLRNVHLVQANLNEKLEVTTIVLTMYDGRTKLAEQVAEEVRTHFGSKVCRNVIPRTVRISEAPSFGQPPARGHGMAGRRLRSEKRSRLRERLSGAC